MAKKPTPAPASREVAINEMAVIEDSNALNQVALMRAQLDSAVRAVALQMGYQLPADCTDPDLIQRDISANMRRSVEACLEVGKGLTVLKVACGHGNFVARLDVLGIEISVAQRFMGSAKRFSNAGTSRLLTAAGSQSKLFEFLTLDDNQIDELELTGQTGELALDDVATMSFRQLRAAVREARADKDASEKLLADKNAKIDKLSRHMQKLTPDQKLLELKKEATAIAADAEGSILGGLRQAIITINNHSEERGLHNVFMAGLVGQVQAQLTALRQEFNLPDVSNVAQAEAEAKAALWVPKKAEK